MSSNRPTNKTQKKKATKPKSKAATPAPKPSTAPEGDGIKEVWAENFEEEILKISHLIDKFNKIAMDTEFPGFYKTNTDGATHDPYELIKANVDILKLIQFGITLSDDSGAMPEGINTWQFNLKFDLSTDLSTPESIDLLQEAGINFRNLGQFGISHLVFADYLISSGLVLNEDITWVTFHGAFDYAYLISIICNDKLPTSYEKYSSLVKQYFPKTYDTKIIASELEDVKGRSLQKLGNELAIKRTGAQHQAGSDAHLTLLCYHGLCQKFSSNKIPRRFLNRVFGLGQDAQVYTRGSNTTFTRDSMNNYMYNGQQNGGYFFQHNQPNQQMMSFPQFGMPTMEAPNNFFMTQMEQNFFYYANQHGIHQPNAQQM